MRIQSLLAAITVGLSFISFTATDAHAESSQLAECELAVPCPAGDRSFHARLPDNWDGKSPLPVLLHFHGWGRQGPLIMKHGRIAGATRKLGVLLLAPNGLGRTWDFWDADTDDVDFALQVIVPSTPVCQTIGMASRRSRCCCIFMAGVVRGR